MTGYVRKFEVNTAMSFKISGKQLLKKYNKIWKRVEKSLKLQFGCEAVYGDNDKYIKTKYLLAIWLQIFRTKKMPEEKAPCKCLLIVTLDSLIKVKKKYYPQKLLEECKYEQEKIKMENCIDDDLEKSLSDNDSNDETELDNDECNE